MRKTAIILFLLRIAKLVISILNLSLAARYFGVTVNRDIWILAFNCMIILDTAIWGPINETFRAKFISIRELSGEDPAIKKTQSLLLFTFALSAALVTFVMLYPNIIASIIAPSYKGQDYQKLIKMLIYVAPCFFVNQAIQIGISLLNAYESFYIPEISSFLSNCLNLILIVLFARYIGIYSLLISYYIGVLILLVIICFQIRRLKIPILKNYKDIKLTDFSVFFIFSLPFFFPYFLGQLSSIVEKSIASSLSSGAVSIIDYSRKFTDILTNVILSVLTTILVPVLSLNFSQKKTKEFVSEFEKIYQLGFFCITLIVCMFTGCSDAFVNILYNSGSIDKKALTEISRLAMFYSWASLPVFIYSILGVSLLSSNNGKKIAFWGTIAQLSIIIINLLLGKRIGIYVFPTAMLVAHMIAGVMLLKKFPFENQRIYILTAKNTIIISINAIFFYWLNHKNIIFLEPIARILFNFLLALTTLILQMFIFKLEERVILVKYWQKLFRNND